MKNILIWCWLINISIWNLCGQSINLKMNGLLDQSNGLPPGVIHKVLRSFQGHLWVATQAGLFSYDGKNYRKVKLSAKKEIIPLFLEEDSHGNLWIAASVGLFKLSLQTEILEERLSDGITGFTIGGGNIWIGTQNNQLYQISLRENQLQLIKTFTSNDTKQFNATIEDFNLDEKGALWFRFNGVVHQYSVLSKKLQSFQSGYSKKIYIHEGKSVLSFTEDNRIVIYESNQSYTLSTPILGTRFFPFHYSNTEIAILLEQGQVFLFNISARKFTISSSILLPPNVAFITDVTQYEYFTYFTCNAGILSISQPKPKFKKAFPAISMRSIFQDSQGLFWIGSYGGLFTSSDPTLQSIQKLDFNKYAHCFAEANHTIFIGTEDDGLFFSQKGKIKKIEHPLFNRSKIIFCLEWVPEDSVLWAGTSEGILWVSLQSEAVKPMTNDKFTGLTRTDIQVIKRVRENEIWVGTKYGLFRSRKLGQDWIWDQPITALSTTNITDIQLAGSFLWVGTLTDGLYRIHPDFSFATFGFSQGLSSDNIVRIEPGASSDVWVSTVLGLNHIDGDNIEAYFDYDGLANNEFNFTSSYSHNSTLFFGGINGLTFFKKTQSPDFHSSNNVYLSQVSYKDAESHHFVQLSNIYHKKIIISSENRSISLTLGSSDFNFPWLSRYKYKLDQDSSWTYQGTNNLIFLSGLAPGEHILQLNSCGANGKWSSKILTLRFFVQEPAWLQASDYRTIGIAACMILLAYFFLKKRYVLKKRETEINVGKIIQREMIPPLNRKVILAEKIKAKFPESQNMCEMLYETNLDSKFIVEELSEVLLNPHENLLAWYKNWHKRIEQLLILQDIHWKENILISTHTQLSYEEEFYLSIICKEILQIFIHNQVQVLEFNIEPFEKHWKLVFFSPESKINLTEQQTFWLIEQLDRQISALPFEYKLLQEEGFGLEIKRKPASV